jgi:hypothetical protein
MVIDDFDVVSLSMVPSETNPELIVDPNAVLSYPVSFKLLKPVSWNRRQVEHAGCSIYLHQFAVGNITDRRKSWARLPIEQPRRILVTE